MQPSVSYFSSLTEPLAMTLTMYWLSLFLLLIQSLSLIATTREMFGFWMFHFFFLI